MPYVLMTVQQMQLNAHARVVIQTQVLVQTLYVQVRLINDIEIDQM